MVASILDLIVLPLAGIIGSVIIVLFSRHNSRPLLGSCRQLIDLCLQFCNFTFNFVIVSIFCRKSIERDGDG